MTAAEFRRAIESLHGRAYGAQSAAAQWLGLSPRSVRELVAGDREVPEYVARLLRVLVWAQHHGVLQAVLQAAEQQPAITHQTPKVATE